jgi:hypothetical protein
MLARRGADRFSADRDKLRTALARIRLDNGYGQGEEECERLLAQILETGDAIFGDNQRLNQTMGTNVAFYAQGSVERVQNNYARDRHQ